jgi:RPA family protein
MWTWDSTKIDFSQTCWTFDGYQNCIGHAGAGHPWIIYDEIPVKTVKEVAKKVKKYQKKEKKTKEVTKTISPESIQAIVDVMAESWKQEEMQKKMEHYRISQEVAIESYKQTIRLLIEDEDLSLILIFASI